VCGAGGGGGGGRGGGGGGGGQGGGGGRGNILNEPPANTVMQFNWNSPILLSTVTHKLYLGGRQLFISHDMGDHWFMTKDMGKNVDLNARQIMGVSYALGNCQAGPGGGGRGGGGGAGGGAPTGDVPPPAGGDVNAAAAGRGQGAGGGGGRGGGGAQPKAANDDRPAFTDYPEEFTKRRGNVSAATMDQIKKFVDEGGTVIAIGNAAQAAVSVFKLPLSNHLVLPDGKNVPGTDYYVPGSVLTVAVDQKNPLAHGYGSEADIFFDNSPVWKMDRAAGAPGVELRSVAWFASPTPLKSGWAWGQKYLDKGIEIAEASIGQGRVFVFGNDLLFRAQPHGNFKFFFNAMYLSVAPGLK
jgi:hypothetical protein